MKRLFAILILLVILYFPAGWFCVSRGWFDKPAYLTIAAILGSIASITSLVALVRPPLSRGDVENLEWESVAKVAETAKEIEELEDKRAATESAVEQLTRTRQEMQILVKKASMALFLREQQSRVEESIVAEVDKRTEFKEDLQKYRELGDQIRELGEEIETHPDAALLYEIISRTSSRGPDHRRAFLSAVRDIPTVGRTLEPIFHLMFVVAESLGRTLSIVVEKR